MNIINEPNEILRSYRRLKGLTQEKAAELLDVSQQQYQKYERGETNFSVTVLKKICRILEMPPAVFFSEENKNIADRIENELLKYKDIIGILDENPALVDIIKYYRKEPGVFRNINIKKLLSKISLINPGKKKLVVSIITPLHILISDEKSVKEFRKMLIEG